jgi:pentose-5-phosphate-3-epimerase
MQKPIIPSIHGISISKINEPLIRMLESGESRIIHFDGIDDLQDYIEIMDRFQVTADIHLLSDTPLIDLKTIIDMHLHFPLRVSMHDETGTNGKQFCVIAKENQILPGIAYKLNTQIDPQKNNEFDYFHLVCTDEASSMLNFDDKIFVKVKAIHCCWGNSKLISLDSGVKEAQIKKSIENGVNNLVMGSAIFSSENPFETLIRLNKIALGTENKWQIK